MNGIDGLFVVTNFIDDAEAAALVEQIDALPWTGNGTPPNPEVRRRTQQFGHLFLFQSRTVDRTSGAAPEIPSFAHALINRIRSDLPSTFPGTLPDHVLVNEYLPGQGIMPHMDSTDTFGPQVAIISLISPCIMTFTHKQTGSSFPVLLEPRSLIVMTGPSRYEFKHSISKELVETHNGVTFERGRRISLTFRNILIPDRSE